MRESSALTSPSCRFLWPIVAALLLGGCVGEPLQPAAKAPGDRLCTRYGLRLRASPMGEILTTVPGGASVVLVSDEVRDVDGCLWRNVSYGALQGWSAESCGSAVYLGECQASRGGDVVLYVQVLDDSVLAASMRSRSDTVIAIDWSDRTAIADASDPDEVFLETIGERMAEIEATDPASVTLVLSGHSVGRYLFGHLTAGDGDSGYVHLDAEPDLVDLAEAHPAFAERVEHVFVLGCNTVWPANAAVWRAPFPNIISVSGYAGSAPGAGPAYNFFAETYQEVSRLDRCVYGADDLIRRLGNGSAARWQNWAFQIISRCGDEGAQISYGARLGVDLRHAREEVQRTRPYYQLFFEAETEEYADPPTSTGAMEDSLGRPTPRAHYTGLHAYVSAIDDAIRREAAGAELSYGETPSSQERAELAAYRMELEQSIRLVFFRVAKDAWLADTRPRASEGGRSNYDVVTPWLDGSREEIAEAYVAATGRGLSGAVTIRHIEDLTRMETILFVGELQARLPGDPVVARLDRALVDLDPSEILPEYI